MDLKLVFCTLIILGVCCHFAVSENILFMLYCASYSHRVAHWPLAQALQAKGHNVTFISPWGAKDHLSHPNITEIVPKRLAAFMEDLLSQNFDVNHRAYGLVPPLFMVIDYFCYSACEALYKSEEIKQWLDSDPKVDLIFSDIMVDCAYGLAEKLQAKTALYLPIPMVTKNFESFAMPAETASIPDYDVSRLPQLTFFNRVINAYLPLWYRFLEGIFYGWYQKLFALELGVTDLPDVYEVRDRTSLIMINGDYITDYPRSLPPFVVKVEGIHIKKPGEHNPLSKEVEQFINSESKGNVSEGFMFISFGTVAKAHSLPLDIRHAFFNSIKAIPNMRFIWKWEGDKPDNYPENVMFVKWIDQQDVLAHPKIKGFLTQNGRPSFQEALYNAVPTITFPVLADQDFNAHRAVDLGVSIPLDFVGITEEKITNAIRTLINDDSYQKRTNQISELIKDVPMGPVETALWWTEFALRHTQEELTLLKPMGRHLTWYQKRDLDVWVFSLLLICIFSAFSFYIMKRIWNRFFSKNKKKYGANKLKKS